MPIVNTNFASSFNGGSITSPLTVDVGALATAGGVTIQGTSGANVNRFVVNFLHTLLSLTGDGVLSLSSDDTLGVALSGTSNSGATLAVANDPSGDGVNIGDQGIVYDSGSAELFGVGPNTGVRFHYVAAPADNSILAGDAALWLDATNGASKLMVKAKSANGTVVAAAIALS